VAAPPTLSSAPPAHAPLRPAMVRHTVRKGETLFSIARRYNVTPAQLRAWNKKADVVVKIGEILFLNPGQ
jgi:membrane-bound lytic murein transglycosylase D